MQQFELYHIGFLGLAIVLEIIANIFLKMSDGFRKIWLGLLSLLSVLGAFSAWRRRSRASICRSLMRCGAVSVSPPPSPQAGSCSASG